MEMTFLAKVVRFELAPATPLTKYICFEMDKHIDVAALSCFTGKYVNIIIKEGDDVTIVRER